MRIAATQYAKSLYEAVKDKPQGEIDNILANFVKILKKNNQLKLEEDIIKKFGEIYNKENNIVEAQITSREALSGRARTEVSAYIRAKYGAEEAVLNEKVDQSVKGGIIVRVGDEVMDGSISRQLSDLKKNLKN